MSIHWLRGKIDVVCGSMITVTSIPLHLSALSKSSLQTRFLFECFTNSRASCRVLEGQSASRPDTAQAHLRHLADPEANVFHQSPRDLSRGLYPEVLCTQRDALLRNPHVAPRSLLLLSLHRHSFQIERIKQWSKFDTDGESRRRGGKRRRSSA